MSESRPTIALLAIVGPTAVGKTALSLGLAERLGGEIVSADSRQIYRGMDIGTAKPAAAELGRVPHHLIDIIDPDEEYSLALYLRQAGAAIEDIAARGGTPLVVGGTGQYVAALLEGWQVPHVSPQPELRAALEREAEQHGVAALYERLLARDPEAAQLMQPSNLRRIIRALEVMEVTGEPFSAQRRREPPPYRITTLWLERERADLYRRIDERVDQMVAQGLVEEVRGLIDGGYGWELPALSSLGYAEFRPLLEGEAELAACVERLKFNTHNFARRQASWFRRLPGLTRLDASAPDLLEQALRSFEA